MTSVLAQYQTSRDVSAGAGAEGAGAATSAHAWLEARELTAERATEMVRELSASPDAPDDPADAHAKRLALLVFAFGDDARKREHLANEPFARSVAGCLAHPARNVRLLAVETLAALSRFDESLVLPHVSSMMRLLLDPVDALAIIHVLRARRFNDAIRAAAVEESVSLRDALALRGPDAFGVNLGALEVIIELGRHAARIHHNAIAEFLEPEEPAPPLHSDPLGAAGERPGGRAKPARGSALCAAALRALSRAPTVITKHHADAVRLWKDRGTGEVARCAERALMLAGEAQDRLRARIEAGGAALESRGREGSDGDDVAAADGDGMDTDDDDLGEDNDGAQVVIPETVDKDA